MKATRVITLLPRLDGKGYTEKVYEPDKKKVNPKGDMDHIEDIVVYTEPKIFVAILYRDFGEEWIMDHISYIEYARDREISDNKSGD